jgi:hypothetical protein
MKVITEKLHKIYFNPNEVKNIKRLCRNEGLSITRLCQELGIARMTLWRKFACKQPFFYLEIEKMDYLKVLWIEHHEQLTRLRGVI